MFIVFRVFNNKHSFFVDFTTFISFSYIIFCNKWRYIFCLLEFFFIIILSSCLCFFRMFVYW